MQSLWLCIFHVTLGAQVLRAVQKRCKNNLQPAKLAAVSQDCSSLGDCNARKRSTVGVMVASPKVI